MPAIHIALLRAKGEVSNERVEAMLQSVREIRKHVPGLSDVRCGRNEHPDRARFTHCIIVTAENSAAIQEYRSHPLHEPIAREFAEIEEDSVGCDIMDNS